MQECIQKLIFKKVPGVFFGGGVSVKYAWHFLMVLFLAVSVNAENCRESISSSQIDTSVGGSANLGKVQVDKIVEDLASFYVREVHFGENKNVSIQLQSFRKKLKNLARDFPEIHQYVDRRINELLKSKSHLRENLQHTIKKQSMQLSGKYFPFVVGKSNPVYQKIQEDFQKDKNERDARLSDGVYFSRYDLNPNLENLKYEIEFSKERANSSQTFIIKKPNFDNIKFIIYKEQSTVNPGTTQPPMEHILPITDILFLNKDTFITSSQDGSLKKWSTNKKQGYIMTFRDSNITPLPNSHKLSVKGMLHVSHDHLLSWSSDGTLKLWNTKTGYLIRTYEHPTNKGHEYGVEGALLLENGDILCWSKRSLTIWDFESGEVLHTLEKGYEDKAPFAGVINGKIVSIGRSHSSFVRDLTVTHWAFEYFDFNQ